MDKNNNCNSKSILSGLPLVFLLTTVTILTLVPGSYSISLRFLDSDEFYIVTFLCFFLSVDVTFVFGNVSLPVNIYALCMQGDDLQVKVSSLTSPRTWLSHNFYSLGYCKPSNTINNVKTSSRAFLQGQDFQDSVYTVSVLLASNAFLFVTANAIFWALNDTRFWTSQQKAGRGLPVGFKGTYPGGEEVYFIYNHLSFRVICIIGIPRLNLLKSLALMLNRTGAATLLCFMNPFIHGDMLIIYFINHEYEGPWNEKNPGLLTCNPRTKGVIVNHSLDVPQRIETGAGVVFTYDVSFKETDYRPPRYRSLLRALGLFQF
ncbi:hypothetical protein PTKIN_Ptkin19aG0077200 [Pterospermum kingtungense]